MISLSRFNVGLAVVFALAFPIAGNAQTTGFITTRPECAPPNGAPDALNYIQGPDPILMSNGDVVILVDAGRTLQSGHWEGIFSLVYPSASHAATPRFYGLWATDNFNTQPERGEDEAPFPSAIFFNGKWRIAYTTTFRPRSLDYDRDRVARLDLDNLTYRAQPSQVTNQWIKPIDPNCRPLQSCPGRGSGILGTFVVHPNGDLFVYHPDGNYPTCPLGWVRHRIAANMSVINPSGDDGCISMTGLSTAPTWISDIARGADGNLYMLVARPGSLTHIDEWVSTGDAATIGLNWNLSGRTWVAPPYPNPPVAGYIYAVWDAGYLKEPVNRQIVEPKVVVTQISEGSTPGQIYDSRNGKYYLYYWADDGAPLPPGFGGLASSCALGGVHDSATCTAISGWAWDPRFPNSPISVDVFDGGTKIATVPADIYRADLQAAGKGNGVHGFSWATPASLKNGVAHSITVKFEGSETKLGSSPRSLTCPPEYALTVSKAGAGTGTVASNPAGISCGSDCSESYAAGTVVTLTATPAAGSAFGGWSQDADCTDASVTMTAARACTATFSTTGYALTVGKVGTGSGTVSSSPAGISCGADCAETYSSGTVVSLSTTALTGSAFAGWSGDADCVDGVVTMTAARTCTATFNLTGGTQTVVWVEDDLPAGAVAEGYAEGWNWVSANPAPFSGARSHQSNIVAGIHQHYFYGASATLSVNAGDVMVAYVYLDPANPPSEVMLQWNDGTWEHRAYWGANLVTFGTDGTISRRYMGALPPAGQWVRLEVPASLVGLEGRTLNGMAFTLWGGRATWDLAGLVRAQTCSAPDSVWIEDDSPAGAFLEGYAEGWSWVSANPAPFSGARSHQSNVVAGIHQHYFYGAAATLSVNAGDVMVAYVYLDPANPPSEVMLQWNDGSWDHRAYWGANLVTFGTNGTISRRFMGALPPAGQWVRLEVPASLVGLEGATLNGMAFTLWDGRATWDRGGTAGHCE